MIQSINWIRLSEPLELDDFVEKYRNPNDILDMTPLLGMLLKFNNNQIILIGDVNSHMGCCDCCSEAGIVTHYSLNIRRFIYSELSLKEYGPAKRMIILKNQ